MAYVPEQIELLHTEYLGLLEKLQSLQLQTVVQGQSTDSEPAKEYLLHGIGRRIGVIRKSVLNVFQLFPMATSKPLPTDTLSDVQINLHAFVINIYGIFDNWAWAFVLRHGLLDEIGDRKRIGLFHGSTQKHLPKSVKQYLSTKQLETWHDSYLKSFRDALAHRIPLYVPPAEFTKDDGDRYSRLENDKVACIKNMEWERLDQLWIEQALIGNPCFCFVHSFEGEDGSKLVPIHSQLIADGLCVAEFGRFFLEHWHERV